MAKKAGSDGQIRKTQAEWDADSKSYLEGTRMYVTRDANGDATANTGKFKISNGGTFADVSLYFTPGSGTGGGAENTDELTNNSTVSGSTTTDALNTLLGADQSLDDEKQDRLLSILTINNDNHTLLGTEYFIRATGSDPTWVTDTGNLSAGYPLELANDSTNDLTFVPDSGSNIVLPPGARASLRHRSGGSWISMFSGVDTALAAKAKVVKLNGTAQPNAVIEVRTGTTDVNGEMSFNLSAYTSVAMIAPFIDRTPCDEVEVVDDTPATYTVAFRYAAVGLSGSAQVTLLCTP